MDNAEFARRQLVLAEQIAGEVAARVTKLLREKHRPFLDRRWSMSLASRQRLLIWRAWTLRYRVTYRYILDILIPFYDQVRGINPDTVVLGHTLSILTSSKARERLEEAVKRDFPGGENYLMWKQEYRQRLAKVAVTARDLTQHPLIFPEAYVDRIAEIRQQLSGAASKFPRTWRDNPYL